MREVLLPSPVQRVFSLRRCQALYDCEADREDELSFSEGEVIVITRDTTEDEDWMEGFLERDPRRTLGLFPASFVRFFSTQV